MLFHLVSRTHRGERWFVPELRDRFTRLIPAVVSRTDARLLAFAVMPNHLHILLRQGEMPLSASMQPLVRRVAYRVQRHHGIEGTVVERRFRDRLCESPDHAREALMYVHLNPWRAGLCGGTLDYPGTTYRAYLPGADPAAFGIAPEAQRLMLELFALTPRATRDDLCRDHLVWLRDRMTRDIRWRAGISDSGSPESDIAPSSLHSGHGDAAWLRHFAAHADRARNAIRRPRLDLRDRVMAELTRAGEGATLDQLRGSWLSRPLARMRARVIRGLSDDGYRTGDLARLFGTSPTTVSRAKYGYPAAP